MNNIILCGFMGCGKTTVGKVLARMLAMEYIDLDTEIQQDAGLTIPDIFAQYGEAHFRDLEHVAVKGLAKRISCVVSTGGGAMTFERNTTAISPHDMTVFLDASFETCYERIRESDRPLIHNNTPQQLAELFERRRVIYRAACAFTVDGDPPAEEVSREIIRLREHALTHK